MGQIIALAPSFRKLEEKKRQFALCLGKFESPFGYALF